MFSNLAYSSWSLPLISLAGSVLLLPAFRLTSRRARSHRRTFPQFPADLWREIDGIGCIPHQRDAPVSFLSRVRLIRFRNAVVALLRPRPVVPSSSLPDVATASLERGDRANCAVPSRRWQERLPRTETEMEVRHTISRSRAARLTKGVASRMQMQPLMHIYVSTRDIFALLSRSGEISSGMRFERFLSL